MYVMYTVHIICHTPTQLRDSNKTFECRFFAPVLIVFIQIPKLTSRHTLSNS